MKTLTKSLAVLLLACLMAVSSFAQTSADERNKRIAEMVDKMIRVELINQLLPVMLTKDQLKALLKPIERSRTRVRELRQQDHDELKRLEAQFDEAIEKGQAKGSVPPQELMAAISKVIFDSATRTQIVASENIEEVMTTFKQVANKGQLKAAANSLNPKFFNPKAKPEEMSQDDKIRVYVSEVLLHVLAYDIIIRLSR